jgi:hypothetical protein
VKNNPFLTLAYLIEMKINAIIKKLLINKKKEEKYEEK